MRRKKNKYLHVQPCKEFDINTAIGEPKQILLLHNQLMNSLRLMRNQVMWVCPQMTLKILWLHIK